MSGPKHTAWPWAFSKRGQRVHGGKTGGVMIAQIGNNPEWIENAHLIAGAPELLEAAQLLEAAEDFYHNDCRECEGEGVPELCPSCFPLFDDARVKRRLAIAKATGEHPMPLKTRTTYADIVAMRSPETVAALAALVDYTATNPDPRDPDHAPALKRLQSAYTDAAQADGSFYAALAEEREGFAEKQEAYALDYPDHAESYLAKAARFREGAAEARAVLATIVPAERLAA